MTAPDQVERMRAIVCCEHRWPQTLTVTEVERPAVRPGHVLVRTAAAGVNFADVLVIEGSYQEKLVPPFIPGVEIAGTVVEVGHGTRCFAAGDRVMGQITSGGYAEYAVLDERRAAPIPQRMTFFEAAGFYIPYGTAHAGLVSRGRVRAGETVLVTGAAGAVGRAAVEVAAAMGARVIAVAGGKNRRQQLLAAGAERAIDNAPEMLRERTMELTEGHGVDVVFDVVGGETTRQALRCLAFEGRLILLGFASGEVASLPANHLLVKNVDVIGFYWGPYQTLKTGETARTFETLSALHAAGQLNPRVASAYALEEVETALLSLARREHSGRIVVDLQ